MKLADMFGSGFRYVPWITDHAWQNRCNTVKMDSVFDE